MWPKRERLSTCSLTLLLLLLLAYAKKDFLSSLIFIASLDSNSFLAFFIETLACHLPWTMPVALITAADGVYHPTSAALIIGRQRLQGRRSIYPDRYLPSWISNGPLGLEIAEPSGRS